MVAGCVSPEVCHLSSIFSKSRKRCAKEREDRSMARIFWGGAAKHKGQVGLAQVPGVLKVSEDF